MDFDDLFSGESIIRVKFKGHLTEHHLRQPTADEDLEYRRRSSKIDFRNRHLNTTDAALQAPLWLYDKLVKKVMIQNGVAQLEEVPIEKLRDQPRLKLEVINAFLSDIEREEAEEIKNS